MKDLTFMPGNFFDNIDKFASALGYQNAGIVFELSMIPWQSIEDRDAFIMGVTQNDVKSASQKNYIKQDF